MLLLELEKRANLYVNGKVLYVHYNRCSRMFVMDTKDFIQERYFQVTKCMKPSTFAKIMTLESSYEIN